MVSSIGSERAIGRVGSSFEQEKGTNELQLPDKIREL